MANYIVAIDLGTTKVVSMVGEKINSGPRYRILAYEEAPSLGIRRGQIENIQSVVSVVQPTLDSIKIAAGISEIKEVYVGIAGQHLRYTDNSTELLRDNFKELITEEEIKLLADNACKLHLGIGEEILHAVPQTYSIDDVDDIIDPVGRLGHKLVGHFHVIIEKGISTKHTDVCMQRLNLSLKKMILEPMASARATLSPEEKDMGVAMIDMGGGTTDLIIYQAGVLRRTAVIPFGGNTITNDIKTGCSILFEQAERIKIQYGSCVPSMIRENKYVTIPGVNGREVHEISFKSLATIIEARLSEIMDMVFDEIKQCNKKLTAGIVFTGGGSQMTHLREFIKLKTGMDVRIGLPDYISSNSAKEIIQAKYSTAVGLIMCGFDYQENKTTEKKTKVFELPKPEIIDSKPELNPQPKPVVESPTKQKLLSVFKHIFIEETEETKEIKED
jgi:cell division protein FtsA